MLGGDAGHPQPSPMRRITHRPPICLVALLACACGGPHTTGPSATGAATATGSAAAQSATAAASAAATAGSPSPGTAGQPVPGSGTATTSTPAGRSTTTGGRQGGTPTPAPSQRSSQPAPVSDVCPPPPPPGSGRCPDPCTCPDYTVTGDRWPLDGTGHVVVHYRINPSGVSTSLSTDQLIAAITAAAQGWMDADPVVELVYDGTTGSPPALNNVVGFVDNGAPGATDGGMGKPFDIQLAQSGWVWRPCDPAHGSPCTDYYTGNGASDLQQVVTHEWGHVLGVNHAGNANDQELTMFGAADGACADLSSGYTCRYADTLGYGDVLGERALYPTSAPFTLYSP